MNPTIANVIALLRQFIARHARWSMMGVVAVGLLFGCSSTNKTTASRSYLMTTLTADQPTEGAPNIDPNLVNPWGLAYGPQTFFWTANNGSGTATVNDGSGVPEPQPAALVITVPPAGTAATGAPVSGGATGTPDGGITAGNPPVATVGAGASDAGGDPPTGLGKPTGLVFNGSSAFMGDRFIFASLDGSISGWISGAMATVRLDNSAAGASYTGLAIGSNGSIDYLYAADFAGGKVDVLDGNYTPVNLGAGSFVDPTLPAGFSPFGIHALGNMIAVTYAQRTPGSARSAAGAGLGYVSMFAMNGKFSKRLISGGQLNAPWGLVMAPSDFASSSEALLVGNFGDGRITAFNPSSGAELGQLKDTAGTPITIDGLWGLVFGNGAQAGDKDTLYFVAGTQGETHGIFGSIKQVSSSNRDGGSKNRDGGLGAGEAGAGATVSGTGVTTGSGTGATTGSGTGVTIGGGAGVGTSGASGAVTGGTTGVTTGGGTGVVGGSGY